MKNIKIKIVENNKESHHFLLDYNAVDMTREGGKFCESRSHFLATNCLEAIE